MAGLILLDKNNNVCLLKRNFPYTLNSIIIPASLEYYDKVIFTQLDPTFSHTRYSEFNNIFFLEKYQFPRGEVEPNDIDELFSSIREALEETELLLNDITILNRKFCTQWIDDNKKWQYTTYLGRINCSFTNLKWAYKSAAYPRFKKNRSIYMENKIRKVGFLQLYTYMKCLTEFQLKCYESSNYLQLFDFIEEHVDFLQSGPIHKYILSSETGQVDFDDSNKLLYNIRL